MNFEPDLRQLHLCANASNAVMNELVESEALKRHNDLFYMKKIVDFQGDSCQIYLVCNEVSQFLFGFYR